MKSADFYLHYLQCFATLSNSLLALPFNHPQQLVTNSCYLKSKYFSVFVTAHMVKWVIRHRQVSTSEGKNFI